MRVLDRKWKQWIWFPDDCRILTTVEGDMKALRELFHGTFPDERDEFIQDEPDKEVYNGRQWYWCLLEDLNTPDSFRILKLKPYLVKDRGAKDGEVFYGWSDQNGRLYADGWRPTHDYPEKVVGVSYDGQD